MKNLRDRLIKVALVMVVFLAVKYIMVPWLGSYQDALLILISTFLVVFGLDIIPLIERSKVKDDLITKTLQNIAKDRCIESVNDDNTNEVMTKYNFAPLSELRK